MRSHRQPVTTLPERNLGAGPEISESDLVPTGSKCRFWIADSRTAPITVRINIRVLPKGGVHMRSHRQSATTLTERNLSAGSEISESDLVPTGSKCRFQIGDSRAVLITAQTNIYVLPKVYDNRCTSTHALRWNFGPGSEFRKTNVLSIISESRF
ncbi:hypothetical protein Taro_023451 [Colocasia esculenta]|uniref:Uncharacterized protein n=1 Tax=Colocasia esculenta TaxID=4460 RepID=A0A843VHE0_COLES|nr:hypothetical protein [Colocasia esculenta]